MSLLYYGLSLNVGNLGGDIYVNYAISSGVEVVAYTVSVPLIWWMGRKKFYCVCMLIGGVSLLASAATDMYGNDCKYIEHLRTKEMPSSVQLNLWLKGG